MRYDNAPRGHRVLPHPARFRPINVCVRAIASLALVLAATGLTARSASAEVSELRLARQYGISHLAMALMDQLQLVQHQAEKAGLKDLKVTWNRFSDGPGMNEALLSGNLDIANGGLTALIVLWDKSKGAYIGLSALSSMPAVLMTRDPAINSDLQFIQIFYNKEGKGGDLLPAGISRQVDSERHNPFYGEGGGLTSIDGDQIVNFSDFIHLATDARALPSSQFIAETFLAQDTGVKDSAGKEIVNIFGGVKWGWQLQRTS